MELSLSEVATHPSRMYDDREEFLMLMTSDWQLDPVLRGRPRASDVARLQRIVDWGVRHDAYFLGLGDYSDTMSPSNREAWAAARLYDSARDAMEQSAERTQEELEGILEATVGRWLGLLQGHHYFEYPDQSTTDTRLAAYLGAPFLGDSTIVHALMPKGAGGNVRRPMAKIWAAHGSGNGAPGRSLAKVEQTGMRITENADVYAMGHMHKVEATRISRIGSIGGERGGQPRMTNRDIILACTGSTLRGYVEGGHRGGRAQGSYVEKALLSPSSMGAVWVSFKPTISSHGYTRLDIDTGTI